MEFASLALSIDPVMNWDQAVMIYLDGKRFTLGGQDCVLEGGERRGFRESFAYFSGQPAAFIPNTTLRRQFVVLDGTDGFRVLYNTYDFTSTKAPEVLEAIHSVMPPGGLGQGLTYAMWADREELPLALAAPGQDADGDGMSNLLECYFGTPAGVIGPSPLTWRATGDGWRLSFPEAKDRQGLDIVVEGSRDLRLWETLPLEESLWTREEGDETDQRALDWAPGDAMPAGIRYLRLKIGLLP